MKLYKLNKTVLSAYPNPALFLSGLTANTLDQPKNAFLNIHGRIIAVFEQAKIDDEEFWMILETPFVEPLLSHLDRYLKLSKVQVKPLDKHVYFNLEDELPPLTKACLMIPQNKGQIVVSDIIHPVKVSDQEFTLFRLRNHIPIQGVDYTDEFVLNIDDHGLVSYTKGCFLGQEPVAKVHNRSKPTWRLVAVYEDQCDAVMRDKMTSKTLDPVTNRMLGFTFKRND